MTDANIYLFNNTVPEIDIGILKNDAETFHKLCSIIRKKCKFTLTDNKSFIICLSDLYHPCWVWINDTVDYANILEIWKAIKLENVFVPELSNKRYLNIKSSQAELLMNICKSDNFYAKRVNDMTAYRCKEVVKPRRVPGNLEYLSIDDLDIAVELRSLSAFEMGVGNQEGRNFRADTLEAIEERRFVVWRNSDNIITAIAMIRYGEKSATITSVYTVVDYRRMGVCLKFSI